MPRVYITLPPEDTNYLPEDRKRIEDFAEVIQHPGPGMPTDKQKLERIKDVDAVVLGRGGGWLTDEMIESATNLRGIGVIGGSVNKMNAELILKKGIILCNTGWAMSNAVAEFSLAMMLCGLRDIPYMIDIMRSDGWGRGRSPYDLTDKAVGLVGFGMIGRRVAELLGPFRARVRVFDPFVEDAVIEAAGATRCGLRELLSTSKVISLHLGLTDETRGLIGADELALIPDGGLLVNTARAAVVDEDALVAELQRGRIRAALNVYWKEPLAELHPLRSMPNVILTPHAGGLTLDTQRRHSQSITDDLERFFAGDRPMGAVTSEMLARMT